MLCELVSDINVVNNVRLLEMQTLRARQGKVFGVVWKALLCILKKTLWALLYRTCFETKVDRDLKPALKHRAPCLFILLDTAQTMLPSRFPDPAPIHAHFNPPYINTPTTAANPTTAAPTTCCGTAVAAAFGLAVELAAAAVALVLPILIDEEPVALGAAADDETPLTAPAEPTVVPLALMVAAFAMGEAETPVLLTQFALNWAVVRGVEVNVMSAHCLHPTLAHDPSLPLHITYQRIEQSMGQNSRYKVHHSDPHS